MREMRESKGQRRREKEGARMNKEPEGIEGRDVREMRERK